MAYRITGLNPAPYRPLFGLPDEELAKRGVIRMTVNSPTFPCRVSLTDRALGETVLLLNHVSHDVANPYRASTPSSSPTASRRRRSSSMRCRRCSRRECCRCAGSTATA